MRLTNSECVRRKRGKPEKYPVRWGSLARAMKERDMTGRDLAEAVEVSVTTTRKWLIGKVQPKRRYLPKIAHAVGRDVSELTHDLPV